MKDNGSLPILNRKENLSHKFDVYVEKHIDGEVLSQATGLQRRVSGSFTRRLLYHNSLPRLFFFFFFSGLC